MPSLPLASVAVANEGASISSIASDELESSNSSKITKVSETAPCNDVPVLRRAAMDYLARREHSLFELTQKLGKRFPDTDKDLLLEVVEVLKSENLQSDERFTESYVRYRKSRGFAYMHIRADLASRRVSESVIGKYLHADDECWLLSAEQLIEKKLRNQPATITATITDTIPTTIPGSKLHRKLIRFLQSRGFGSLEIRKAIEKHLV